MTKEQSKAYSTALNEVWCVYKERFTEEQQPDGWWLETSDAFNEVVERQTDEKIKQFVGKFAVACLKDIQDKSFNRKHSDPIYFTNKDMSTAEFEEYLKNPTYGEMLRVNGQMIQVIKWH